MCKIYEFNSLFFVQKVKSYRKRKVFLDFVATMWYYIRGLDKNPQTKQRKMRYKKMKEFKHETMVITKEAWKFLRNADRVKGGYSELKDEQLEKVWGKIAFRNGGAWSKTHPIAENEIRVENGSWNTFRIEEAKQKLTENGFDYRQDGFVAEGINL